MKPIETLHLQDRNPVKLTGSWAMSPIETQVPHIQHYEFLKLTGSWAMSPIETLKSPITNCIDREFGNFFV